MTYVLDSKVSADIITLSDMKDFLKVTGTSEDTIIQALINAAIARAEKFMNRDLLTTTWINYRESFYEDLTLRRGGFQSLTTIEYLSDESYATLASTEYQVSIGGIFGKICEIEVPTSDKDCNDVKITFKSGFGDDSDAIPEDIKLALQMDVSFLYSNRGDCTNVNMDMPVAVEAIYKGYKIVDLAGENNDACL